MKVDSIEDNISSIFEGSQVKSNHSYQKWYRSMTKKENIDFEHQESESNENAVHKKLSSIIRYSPKLKDFMYTISKVIRCFSS